MVSLLSDRAFERDALDFFPTPLADTLDEAVAEASTRAQRDKVVETFRVAVRLLGVIALAGIQGSPADSGQLIDLKAKLLRQGFTEGEWVGLTRETVRPFAAAPEGFALPALVTTFFQLTGKLTRVFTQQGACDSLLAMRKSETIAHGVSGTEAMAQDILAARLPDCEVFLKSLAWLWHCTFVVPVSRRVRPDNTPEYDVIKLAGVTPRRGFRPEPLAMQHDLTLGCVYALVEGRPPLALHPMVQYAETASGQHEVFLFEEVNKREAVLRTYPLGLLRPDPEARMWLRERCTSRETAPATNLSMPHAGWTLDALRMAACKASDDYLDKMQRERIYLAHLYTRRLELEAHLSGFLDRQCLQTGLLLVGASGIGKTNTLCHIVNHWREEETRLKQDVVLFVGGSLLPGGHFVLRDVLLDRLGLSDSFATFLTTFTALHVQKQTQFVLIVDGVDRHPQPAELLRQLDELVVHGEGVPGFKVVIALSEVVYSALRQDGFIPAARNYYTITPGEGTGVRASVEVQLGTLTEEELREAYEKYRREPGLAPLSAFETLTSDVKNTMRQPLFLRMVMEVFHGRQIPRRTFTESMLLEYCTKKIFAVPARTFFTNRFVDILYDNRWRVAPFDALAQVADLRPMVLTPSLQSPYLQLLDEQILEERFTRVSAILPPQHTVAFAHDRLFEYLLLNRVAERLGITTDAITTLTMQAQAYLPLRGALTMLLLSQVDAGAFADVASLLEQGNAEVMRTVGLNLLMELEQRAPTQADTSEAALSNSPVGQLVSAILARPPLQMVPLLLDVGRHLQELGFYRRAEYLYTQLLGCVDEGADPVVAAQLRHDLADVKALFGQKHQALADYERAGVWYQAAGDRVGEQAVLSALGRVHFDLGETVLAQDAFERSLALAQELTATDESMEVRQGTAHVLYLLAVYYHQTGASTLALDYAQQAHHIRVEIGDRKGLGISLNQLGVLSEQQGHTAEACQWYEEALGVHEEVGDKQGTARSRINLGDIYKTRGQMDMALAYYQQALTIYEDIGDKGGIADALNNIGLIYKDTEQTDKALEYMQRSLQYNEDIGHKAGMAAVLNNLAFLSFRQGNLEQALHMCEQGLALDREIGRKAGMAIKLSNLGSIYRTWGQLTDALECYQQALALHRESGDERTMAHSLNNLGTVYHIQGQCTEAQTSYQQALALHQSIGDQRGIADSLCGMGGIYGTQGQLEEARTQYHQSLAIYQELGAKDGQASIYHALGEMARWGGRHEQALQYAEQALTLYKYIDDKDGVATCLTTLGATCLLNDNAAQALDWLAQAQTLQTAFVHNAHGKPETLAYLALAAWRLDRLDVALSYADAGLQVMHTQHFKIKEEALGISSIIWVVARMCSRKHQG